MAKQSGIHQLRGKVGEHSYYRQTGVPGGLVRAINPAMSNRVKTDEAFANTRLNNAEFGQAGRIASELAMFINPKFRPMVLPFSQSRIAKVLLEYIKQNNAPWGERNLTESNIPTASVDALNMVAKNRFEDFGLIISNNSELIKLTVEATQSTVDKMAAIGADKVDIVVIAASPWIGTFNQPEGKYAPSYARGKRYTGDVTRTETIEIDYTWPSIPPHGWPAITGVFFVVIALPVRTINGEEHVLQEHCTYKAFRETEGVLS